MMGFARRLSEWNAESDMFEQMREAELAASVGRARSSTDMLVVSLRLLALVVAVAGTWGGVVIGRSLEGWSRIVGLAVPGWMVVLAAAVGAAVLLAVAAALRLLGVCRR